MSRKRVLMWMSESELKPVGGPSGYLYNIYQHKLSNEDVQISFLPPAKVKNVRRKSVMNLLKERFRNFEFIALINYLLKKIEDPVNIDFSSLDVIHFHDTISLFRAREIINKFQGIVILTSHSPQPLHVEYLENHCLHYSKKQRRGLSSLLNFIDEYAFMRSDYVMFPCYEAMDPYRHWRFFNNMVKRKKSKFIFCPTGIGRIESVTGKGDYRRDLGIQDDYYVISFIGRHNYVKGYDQLKEIGLRILEKHPKTVVIVAGKEEPITRLNHPRWIELGFVNDPYSLINAADLFLLPNRETFFDLIFLEVLAVGTEIMATYTGGNKYFKKFDSDGITYFTDCSDAVNKISSKINNHNKRGNKNKSIFLENFTMNHFIERYFTLLGQLE